VKVWDTPAYACGTANFFFSTLVVHIWPGWTITYLHFLEWGLLVAVFDPINVWLGLRESHLVLEGDLSTKEGLICLPCWDLPNRGTPGCTLGTIEKPPWVGVHQVVSGVRVIKYWKEICQRKFKKSKPKIWRKLVWKLLEALDSVWKLLTSVNSWRWFHNF